MIPMLAPAAVAVETQEDLFELSLEDLLDVEVSAATASGGPRSESPAHVHVLTREEIRRRGYVQLTDLLDDLPGVDVHERSSPDLGNLVTVRGLTGNQRLLVLIDGFRAQAPSGDPHALGANYALVDVDRVEVVLGPASALYGPDAFVGVVNIVTRTGEQIDGWRLSGELGEYGTQRGEVLAGSGLGVVRWSVAAARFHTAGPDLAEAYPEAYAWYHERYLTEGEVRASPYSDDVVRVDPEPWSADTDAYYLHLRVNVGDLDFGWFRHGEAHSSSAGMRPEFALVVDDARFAYAIDSFHARHVGSVGSAEAQTAVSFSNWAYEPETRFLNTFNGYSGGFKYAAALLVSLEERVVLTPAPWLAVTGGGTLDWLDALTETTDLPRRFDPTIPGALQDMQYAGSDVVDEQGRDLGLPVRYDDFRSTRSGVFVEAVVRPVEPFAVTVGGRIDQDSRYGADVNPRVGVVGALTPTTTIRASFGEAFLSPAPAITLNQYGRFEPALDDEGDIVGLRSDFWHLGAADIGPERLRSIDAGFRQSLGEALVFGGEGWRSDVRDLIVTEIDGPGTFQGWPVAVIERPVNRGRATTYGITAHADARVPAGSATLAPRVAWTWTDGHLEDRPLPYASRHVVEGGVDLGLGPFSAALSGVARSRALHPLLVDAYGDPLGAPAHAVTDLHLRYVVSLSPKGGRIGLHARATNLFDARWYRVGDAPAGSFAATPQDPRQIVGGVEIGL